MGAKETQRDAVQFVGLSEGMTPLFDVRLDIPDISSPAEATPTQMSAVEHFYRSEVPPLNYEQAHALLCCRDFARMVIKEVDIEAPKKSTDLLTVLAAVKIAATTSWWQAAVEWSEFMFDGGGPQTPPLTVPTFNALRLWILELYVSCLKEGADF